MIYRWIVWSFASERRVVWIYGVAHFGGVNAGLFLWHLWARGSRFALLGLVLICLAMGYLCGWLMWQILKRIKPLLTARRTTDQGNAPH